MTPENVADILTRDRESHPQEFIPTGSLGLDLALGGWPVGHISELSGEPDSGKSCLVDYAIANIQKTDEYVYAGVVDAHGTFNPDYAKSIGVDLSRLWVVRSLSSLPFLLMTCALVVIDPLLEVVYPPLLQGSTVLVTTELRRNLSRNLTGPVARTGQLNEISARVSLRSVLHESRRITSWKVALAAFTPPADTVEGWFDILDYGINHALEVLDYAVALGLIEKRGNWYKPLGWITQKIQGRDNTAIWLAEHPSVMLAMETQIRYNG